MEVWIAWVGIVLFLLLVVLIPLMFAFGTGRRSVEDMRGKGDESTEEGRLWNRAVERAIEDWNGAADWRRARR